jgi:hypothetical protein
MYGIDLGDLFRAGTRLTWRRLGVLIEHLPPESATKTALRDELDDGDLARLASLPRRGHGPWSHVELLLAAVHDNLARLVYVQQAKAGAKNLKAPEPMPRPGVGGAKVRAINPAAREYLEQVRARNAAAADGDGSA